MFRKIGQITIAREGADLGGGGGGPAHPIDAPWTGSEGMWNIGEGDAAQPWFNSIPEGEARDHIAAKNYANPGELALANFNLTKLQRNDGTVVSLPGKDAGDEAWNAFHTAMGRPETAEGYELNFGDSVKADEGMVQFGKELFFEMGLSGDRAQGAADKWNSFVQQSNEAVTTKLAEDNQNALDTLATTWGADLEANKAAGQRVVQSLGLPEDVMSKLDDSIGTAAVVQLLATIGRKSDEGGFTSGGGNGDPNDPASMTKEQAASKIASLGEDKDFQAKFTDKNHPGHGEAVKLMERLYSRT